MPAANLTDFTHRNDHKSNFGYINNIVSRETYLYGSFNEV